MLRWILLVLAVLLQLAARHLEQNGGGMDHV